MRFGTWNVRSLYRTGSFTAAASELARYKLDLVDVRDVRWDRGGTVRAEHYIFSLWKSFWFMPMMLIYWEEAYGL